MPLTGSQALDANLTRLFNLFYYAPHPFLSVFGIPERSEAERAANHDTDLANFKRLWRAVGLQRFIGPDTPGETADSPHDVDSLHTQLASLAAAYFAATEIEFNRSTHRLVLYSPQNSLYDPFRDDPDKSNPCPLFRRCYDIAFYIVPRTIALSDHTSIFTTPKHDLRLFCSASGEFHLFCLEKWMDRADVTSAYPAIASLVREYRRNMLGEETDESDIEHDEDERPEATASGTQEVGVGASAPEEPMASGAAGTGVGASADIQHKIAMAGATTAHQSSASKPAAMARISASHRAGAAASFADDASSDPRRKEPSRPPTPASRCCWCCCCLFSTPRRKGRGRRVTPADRSRDYAASGGAGVPSKSSTGVV